MSSRYSLLALLAHAARRHRGWPQAFRHPERKRRYRVAIVGGGGHGLATAYYLAKNHGIRDVVVLEKGWIGGGNTGRNTTIVRSNYLLDENLRFYEHSLKLWEGLTRELNFNLMLSQRGVVNTFHSPAEQEYWIGRYNHMRLSGVDAVLLSRDDLARLVPALDLSPAARFPVLGAVMQPRGGVARHDAVAWGYARAADALGVDIVQGAEVIGFDRRGGRIVGVETRDGVIQAEQVAIAVAGHSSQVAALAGIRLPIETHLLQAMVTEPVKPFLDKVISAGAVHMYISQTDKGEVLLGGALDGHVSYSQRGSPARVASVLGAAVEMFPRIGRLRILRHWGGTNDMTMDGSPILGKLPVDGLYMTGGWCYGGFKATPASGWCLAHTIAHDRPHELNAAFGLERFGRGAVIDERGAGPDPRLH